MVHSLFRSFPTWEAFFIMANVPTRSVSPAAVTLGFTAGTVTLALGTRGTLTFDAAGRPRALFENDRYIARGWDGRCLEKKGVTLAYPKTVLSFIGETGFVPAEGARPIRKKIELEIEQPIAEFLLMHPKRKKLCLMLQKKKILVR
jgi:hypothetical protein